MDAPVQIRAFQKDAQFIRRSKRTRIIANAVFRILIIASRIPDRFGHVLPCADEPLIVSLLTVPLKNLPNELTMKIEKFLTVSGR
jgi:hypothetical protein